MKRVLPVILYVAIALLTVQNHVLIAALLAVFFTYRVGAIWLIPLAICIDGFFGAFYHVPLFSIITTVWYLVSELVRPALVLQAEPKT